MKGILCKLEVVKNILAGDQTQHRTPMRKQPPNCYADGKPLIKPFMYRGEMPDRIYHCWAIDLRPGHGIRFTTKAPHQVGDILGIRERARLIEMIHGGYPNKDRMARFIYEVDGVKTDWVTYPDRLKPLTITYCVPNGCYKELIRIFLEVTGVRCERVQDISWEDCRAEGCKPDAEIITSQCEVRGCKGIHYGEKWAFQSTWNTLYPGSWERNDWVFITDFKKTTKEQAERN